MNLTEAEVVGRVRTIVYALSDSSRLEAFVILISAMASVLRQMNADARVEAKDLLERFLAERVP